jgi:hypothetical protein
VLLIIALCIAHNVDSMGRDMMHPIQEVYLLRGCDEDGWFTLQSQARKGNCSFSSVLMD